MPHYDYDELKAQAGGTPPQVTITLQRGDTAYAPGTTKYWLATAGVAWVEYTFWPDGGVEAHATEGSVYRAVRDARIT